MYVTELLVKGWTDFDEILCAYSSGSENGLYSHLDLVGGATVSILGYLSNTHLLLLKRNKIRRVS